MLQFFTRNRHAMLEETLLHHFRRAPRVALEAPPSFPFLAFWFCTLHNRKKKRDIFEHNYQIPTHGIRSVLKYNDSPRKSVRSLQPFQKGTKQARIDQRPVHP